MNFKFSERREKFESIGQSSRFKNFAGHDSQTVSSRCKIFIKPYALVMKSDTHKLTNCKQLVVNL